MATAGALTGLTGETTEEESVPVEYGVFQNTAVTQDPNIDLQTMYGTAAVPTLTWVTQIQTGERSFDPSSQFDNSMLEDYQKLVDSQGQPTGMMGPGQISKQVTGDTLSQIGQTVGASAGAALVDPYMSGDSGAKLLAGAKGAFKDLPSELVADSTKAGYKILETGLSDNAVYYPELSNKATAAATGNEAAYNALKGSSEVVNGRRVYEAGALENLPKGVESNIAAEAITSASTPPTFFEGVGNRLWGEGAKANWSAAGGAGLAAFGVNLLMGKKPKEAAKSAGASAIGMALGNAILPGIGGVVGSMLGGALGGRVICNELMRQGLMDRQSVILDYRFTRDYLSPQHVNGYHVWAVWMVKQMRKGRFVGLWKHLAQHRSNEIAYIYGQRTKPDYLGKIYRKILEPTCWVVGAFTKKTDWSVLYKTKEA